ncbi:MAG: HPr family phosphocarrier protein [Deltaproteobacteria bacterium]|nr:HPr family phosphocarrier protein [Deltaproteobacteria bacterium]
MRIERELQIKNMLGIHARVAARIVAVTNKYASSVFFRTKERQANAKNLIDLLTLSCPLGSIVTVEIDGSDAKGLFEELQTMADDKFGEE